LNVNLLKAHVVQGSVGADRAALLEVTLLGDNGGDTTCRETGRAGADEDGKLAEELTFLEGGLDTEEVVEDTDGHEQLVGGVGLHEREEGSVERVSLLELVRVLAEEEVTRVDELAENETEDLAEVETGNHLLKRLLADLVGRLVDDNVVLGTG
jgi:hypothetical protein